MRKEPKSAKQASNKKILPALPKQDFTLEQLRFYDGVASEGRLLIGVLGEVYDVSSSAEFYGPGFNSVLTIMLFLIFKCNYNNFDIWKGGPYSVFSGRDASRALATFSVDKSQFKDEHDDLSDLSSSQLDSVKEWQMQFLGTLHFDWSD